MKHHTTKGLFAGLLLATQVIYPAMAAGVDNGGPITKADLVTPVTSFPTDLVAGANHTQFANYAWRLFIAATQQTTASLHSGAGRGVGNGVNNFIQTGSTPATANPLVFESFYHRTEAFPFYSAGNKPPSPINALPVYYTYYADKNDKPVPYTLSGQNYVYLDETNQIGQNFLYYQNSFAPDFPVLFMAKVNDIEANYALNKTTLPSAKSSWLFPNNVVEVKTAWRRVKDIKNSNPSNYHQASATYYVADASGVPVPHTDTFALIAIHIIQKTANYQQFIFTTFEHVNAVTRNSSNVITDPAYKTTYNNLAYQSPNQDPHTATANGAYSNNRAGLPAQPNKLTTYTLPKKGAISQNYTTVVQPNTITKEVNDVNNQVNALVKSLSPGNIWANYRLKGVQAVATSNSDTKDYFLANIVVESSQPGIQLFTGVLLNGGVPVQGKTDPSQFYFVNCRGAVGSSTCIYPDPALNTGTPPSTYNNVSLNLTEGGQVPSPAFSMGGCQGCHGAAQQVGRDFSFLANGATGRGKELDSVPAASLSSAAKAAHNAAMASRRANN